MFGYYLELALRSFRRNKVLTTLMVLAIALGIGAAMTTLTVFYILSGDPLPGRSQTLFYPQLDAMGMEGYVPGQEPGDLMTRYDAETLLREQRGDRQALSSAGDIVIEPQAIGLDPFYAQARYTSSDFFAMFNAPFLYGGGWGKAEDNRRSRIVVISKPLNDKLFGGSSSVGKTLRLDEAEFRIVGVLDDWRPVPKFYDLTRNGYREIEQVFLPFSTSRDLRMRADSRLCWGSDEDSQEEDPEGDYGVNASCVWVQYWVQLNTSAKVDAYRRYLVNYSEQQRTAGRYPRPTNVRLRSLMEWLDYKQVVPGDVRLQVWLAFGFLLACLLNTAGLLLATFLRRRSEIAIRRALGASRRAIFAQFLIEAGVIGLAGGALGLVFALLGLWVVRQQPDSYAKLAQLDPLMLITTFVLAIIASVLAGLLPAWRACRSDLPFSSRRSGSSSRPSSARWGRGKAIAETVMLKVRPMLSALRRHKITAALVVLQIALNCAILCNAVFLIGSRIERMHRVSGLTENQIVHIELASIGKNDNPAALTREDLATLRALPGVIGATSTNQVPFGSRFWHSGIHLQQDQTVEILNAADYFGDEQLLDTLGLNLIAGRRFTADEFIEWEMLEATSDDVAIPAAIITRSMADKLFPGENAVGKSFYSWGKTTVVGIVDHLTRAGEQGGASAYEYSVLYPVRIPFTEGRNYLLKVGNPARRAEVLKAAVDALKRINPKRIILKQQTLEQMRTHYYQRERAMVWLLAAVCVALLVITALGIMGLTSFWVQQRTQQIGIRRALGATRGQILRYFQAENFLLVTLGIVLGMALAYGLNGLLMRYYELPRLPIAYLPIGAITLWTLGQLAVLGPALRAAAVSPAVATRNI